ncbi:MAG: DUF2997 domain-containing protein [Candidatus Sericytochromatia bacterium]
MESQEMEITISPTGEVNIQVKGVHGASCLDLTKGLEQGLGTVEDRQMTAEYYEQQQNQQNNQWNQGGF